MKNSLLSKFIPPVSFATNYFNAKKDAIRSIFAGGSARSVPVETETTRKYPTWTCALMQLACENSTTIEELNYQIERLKEENLVKWDVSSRASGETCIFCVTTPYESELAQKLTSVGFHAVHQFKRRNGYIQSGLLTLWVLNVA